MSTLSVLGTLCLRTASLEVGGKKKGPIHWYRLPFLWRGSFEEVVQLEVVFADRSSSDSLGISVPGSVTSAGSESSFSGKDSDCA